MQNFPFAHLSEVTSAATMDAGSQTNAFEPSNSNGTEPQKEALVYRVEDIARMLSISLRAAYNLCNTTKEFRVLHIGTSIRVSKNSFDEWFTRASN